MIICTLQSRILIIHIPKAGSKNSLTLLAQHSRYNLIESKNEKYK